MRLCYLGKDFDLRMMKVSRRRFPSFSWASLPSQNESSFLETSASLSLFCTLIATYRMFVGSLLSLLCNLASSTEPTWNPNLMRPNMGTSFCYMFTNLESSTLSSALSKSSKMLS